jgi:mannosyltransferase
MDAQNKYLYKITPLLLIILNLILKIIFIESNSIGGDEPFSIYHAQLNVSSIIEHLRNGNNPPLYEIILHFWINLFGISEFSVRFPSFIFSVLTVLYIYKIGKNYFSYQIALISSLLFSFSNYHIAFAHEARVYSLFALLTTMSMYFFLVICNKQKNFKYFLILLSINITLLYSHYLGFYVIAIQTISVAFIKDNRGKLFSKYLVYLLSLLLLYIPNLRNLIMLFLFSSKNGTWVKSPNGVEGIYNMLWQFSNKPLTTVIAIGILLLSIVKFITKKDLKNLTSSNKIILIWFLFPFLFMFVISYWIPMFLDRYLIFVSISFYLILSISSVYILSQSKYKLILPGILVLLFIFTFNPNIDNKRHVRETVEKVRELKDPKTKVLICPQYFIYNFAYYYSAEIFKGINFQDPYYQISKNLLKENIYTINNINEVNLDNCNKVVFVDAAAQFSFPENNILNRLKKEYKLKNTHKYYEIFNVYEFDKK